jgi:arylformamidase
MKPVFDFRDDPDWLDNQYNNRLRVPDFLTRHVQRWQTDSAAARRQPCHLDIAYGSHSSEKLDIFPAKRHSDARTPVLVFIHGGYWRSLDKADHSFVAPAFTREGMCVVVPNYALCSAKNEVTIDQIVMQMAKALAWVYRHIADYGGDPQRITVIGHSAGGHLAAMMAACEWERMDAALPTQLVRNAMSISGLHDLAPIRACPYLQLDLKLSELQVQRCSPAYFAKPRAPLVAVCGAEESGEFLRQNQLIEEAWGIHHVPSREAMLGHNHFSVLESLLDPAHRTHALAMNLLKARS